MGLLLLLATGLAPPDVLIPAIVKGEVPEIEGRALETYKAYSAPYRGLGDEAFNGYRGFPLSIPLEPESYARGNGATQTHHYTTLLGWDSRFISSGDVLTTSLLKSGAGSGPIRWGPRSTRFQKRRTSYKTLTVRRSPNCCWDESKMNECLGDGHSRPNIRVDLFGVVPRNGAIMPRPEPDCHIA